MWDIFWYPLVFLNPKRTIINDQSSNLIVTHDVWFVCYLLTEKKERMNTVCTLWNTTDWLKNRSTGYQILYREKSDKTNHGNRGKIIHTTSKKIKIKRETKWMRMRNHSHTQIHTVTYTYTTDPSIHPSTHPWVHDAPQQHKNGPSGRLCDVVDVCVWMFRGVCEC